MMKKRAFEYLDASFSRINSADVSYGYARALVDATEPSISRTVKAVKEVMYLKK